MAGRAAQARHPGRRRWDVPHAVGDLRGLDDELEATTDARLRSYWGMSAARTGAGAVA